MLLYFPRYRGNVVGIATTLRTGRSRVRIPVGARNDSVLHNFQTQPPIQCTGVLTRWVKRPGREVNHTTLPSTEVENDLSYRCPSSICLHGAERENTNFTVHYFICLRRFCLSNLAVNLQNLAHFRLLKYKQSALNLQAYSQFTSLNYRVKSKF